MLTFILLFLFSLGLSMIIPCSTSMSNDKLHAIPADVRETIQSIPVIDKVLEVDVAPILTIVSTDSKFEFRVF